MTKKVVCVVLNDVKRDARVQKEARSLQAAGYDVQVVGFRRGAESIEFQYDGLPILLVGHEGYGRAGILARIAVMAARTVLAVLVVAVLYLIVSAALRGSAPIEDATVIAALATIAVAGIAYRIRRVAIDKAHSLLYILRLFGSASAAAPPPLPPELPKSREQPSRWMTALLALSDATSCAWIASLIDQQNTVCRELRGREFDILHCHDFTTLRIGWVLKRERPDLKLVYDSHEIFSAIYQDAPLRHNWIRLSEKRISRSIDACITVNDNIARELKSYYPALPTPVVLCNATPLPEAEGDDPDAAPPLDDGRLHQAAGLSPDRKILLFQGGLARHRGLRALTMAATFLPEEWCLVYMGWGRFEKDVREIARLVDDAEERIRFVPPVAQNELAAWTAGATIGVIPYEPISLNHLYSSPNKLWEYPRSGVPVLCSEAPEMRRRIEQYGFGWLIPFDRLTPRGIAAIVARLSDAQIAAARRACRDFIAADNWSVYEERLLDLYGGLNASARRVSTSAAVSPATLALAAEPGPATSD